MSCVHFLIGQKVAKSSCLSLSSHFVSIAPSSPLLQAAAAAAANALNECCKAKLMIHNLQDLPIRNVHTTMRTLYFCCIYLLSH